MIIHEYKYIITTYYLLDSTLFLKATNHKFFIGYISLLYQISTFKTKYACELITIITGKGYTTDKACNGKLE